MNNYIAIMAGGIGSRFWPSSTSDKPKQFLDILGVGKSLLRMTYERALRMVPVKHIFIVTNKRYLDLVQGQLPEIPRENIILEPSMNNTAPCIAYTSLKLQNLNPNAVMAVLASDHVILKEEVFFRHLHQAFDFASKRSVLVTLGIEPTRADTGYGYIQYDKKGGEFDIYGVKKVISFKEKPTLEVAAQYVNSGDYVWNSGMFIWSVKSILEAFSRFSSEIMHILASDTSNWNTSSEQAYIDRVYPMTPNISVDYAIMEKAENVYTIPANIGWSDLGTWNSLFAYLSDGSEAVTIGKNIHLMDSKDVLVMSNNDKTIVIKGLKDYIIVDEDNALLIYPKSAEQEIKEVVKKLS